MDAVDERILAALERDGRLSMRALARAVTLSAPSVAERVRKLEERGVITGYGASVRGPLPATTVEAFVDVIMTSPAHERLDRFVASQAAVREAHRLAGAGCYILRVLAPDNAALDALVAELSQFANYRLSVVVAMTAPSRDDPAPRIT